MAKGPSPILTFTDNGKILDGEFLQTKPDPLGSDTSVSDDQSLQAESAFCDKANQTRLNQILDGPCSSYRKSFLLGAVFLITIASATLASSKATIYSAEPSSIPSDMPSDMPSLTPSSAPTMNPTGTYKDKVETIFYAIGDVPYNDLEKVQLRDRMINLPQDGEFLVHLGDIRSGKKRTEPCRLEQYQQVRDLLLQSKIPVFIIPGDNEWNECPNHQDGERFWKETFHDFDKRWNHTIQVYRHPMPELFYFVHKRTLFFGLNLVGGKMTDYEFYFNKFRYEFEVVKSMIDKYVVAGNAVNVVIFGHAFPKDIHHRSFFEPLRDYIDRKLKNKVPILYLNGDKHVSGSVGEYAKFIFMCTDCPMIRNCSSTSLRRITWVNQTSIDCKWTLVQFTHP
mmetsp:Transcript_3497/g.7942  ORF Transcript_3497/g.7942 Transcript_3497/m.7942 type:complete len:395 (+) Transcript_3497:42-1226(+)